MSKKYCQQCPVCNEFTDNLIIHVNSHFEKETFDNKSQVLRNKSELPIISENNVLTILKCTDKQSLISKNKNKGSDEEQRQKAQTAQKDLLIPQSIEDTLLAAQTAQEDFLLAQALQEEEKNDILNKCDSDFLIALNLQNHEDTVHEKTTLEAESASIFNKYKNDFLLASELQSYENIVNEKEDFKKLQAMYGMNSSSGFMKQFDARVRKDVGKYITVSDYYKKKSDMLSSLMEGKDNLETSTKGIIDALKNQYMYGVVGVKTFKLCCNVTHFGISIADRGWGCGYRNIQMLISSLFEHDQYKLKETMPDIPSIPKIQALIEKAWSEGYDPTGKEQLDGKLQGTRKWIGTTEVCALLRSLKLKAQIVDFHKPNENLHVLMMEWICDYFQNGLKLPLYLQHQGHSRLCIGIEEHKDKECFLLLLDPSTNVKQMQSFISLQNQKNMIKHFRKSIKQLRQKEFQILYIDGAINIPKEIQESKYISSIRIP
ncbi:zinc finger-containing ubiquitin peptidase 1 isoform X1 [Hydra vulgaris]|uniref:zinc finger-containing ubiquitin peptidase 1 isoform X1 n=1 Tax=Hydra vulgaris TaxID=6087 RepID=UPI0032EA7442